MIPLNMILICLSIIGLALIIMAYFKYDREDSSMNDFREDVMEELNAKYQEILYLYNLVDENKEKINAPEKEYFPEREYLLEKEQLPKKGYFSGKSFKPPEAVKDTDAKSNIGKNITPNLERPLIKQKPNHIAILDMYSKGDSISRIAKNLNIGQGEVKLVIELNRNKTYAL